MQRREVTKPATLVKRGKERYPEHYGYDPRNHTGSKVARGQQGSAAG
jgi:hypothetical protein